MVSIVVIDDDEDLRDLMELRLKASGYDVHPAGDGLMGLELIRWRRPDLVVVDWTMPRMDGIAMCREMRNDPALAEIPVLMVSARTTAADRRVSMAAGCTALLPKPFSLSRLADTVRSLLDKDEPLVGCRC
ncbi:response regulator transcription factor [Nocardioides marmorisolisilvae]|uniref:Response regulator n=1 Tax=Nocardioides marmorisolisilvae TaxID=1542737 RepID=A0A3N0DSP6_9ACTN|nr:response regulator [Nocardioides marmorisolisilvae]RNL78496.1 response regulator [Nocardioides marmorisolisilvae]